MACIINSATVNTCGNVSRVIERLLESRSSCLYEYLKSINFDRALPIFSNMLTAPILLSFYDPPLPAPELDTILEQVCRNMKFSRRDIIDGIKRVLTGFYVCNVGWNTTMNQDELMAIKSEIDIEYVPNHSEKYKNLLHYTQFLWEVQGILNRKNFKSRSNAYMIDTGGNIGGDIHYTPANIDADCKTRITKSDCERDLLCILRKTSGKEECIDAKLFRNLRDTQGGKAFMSFESPFKLQIDRAGNIMRTPDGKSIKKKFIYKSRFTMEIFIGGWAGIFAEYEIGRDATTNTDKAMNTHKCVITFPPLNFESGEGKLESMSNYASLFKTFYSNSYLVYHKGAYVHGELYKIIHKWYTDGFSKIKYPKDYEIHIVGLSLGGALTNLCAFYLSKEGYTNISWYAYGAPRVGGQKNIEFATYMSNQNWGECSGNYVKFMNVIKTDGSFFTEFDPVTTFPIHQRSLLTWSGWKSSFKQNPLFRCMGAGFTWNPVLNRTTNTSDADPDYDLLTDIRNKFSKEIKVVDPLLTKSIYVPPVNVTSAHFEHMHSAYDVNVFLGISDYSPLEYRNSAIVKDDTYDPASGTPRPYHNYENSIKDLRLDP